MNGSVVSWRRFVGAAVAACALLAAGPPSRAEAEKAVAPGLDRVAPLALFKDGYLFTPILARGVQGRLHLQFYRGVDHYGKGHAGIGYAYSDDDGRTWTEAPDAVSADDPQVYDRLGSFGITKGGKLLTLFLRRNKPGQKPIPYQVESTDGGRSWSAPHPSTIVDGSGGPFKYSWPYSYGPIRHTPSGVLAVMAYVGEDNSVFVSRDEGATWSQNRVVTSDSPNYSEMGLDVLDETTWLAVSRLDDQHSRMVQFISRDSGITWTSQGDVDLPYRNGVYAAPTIDDVRIGNQRKLVFSYCDRRLKTCEFRVGSPDAVVQNARGWGPPTLFDQRFFGRSGYQSFVPSRDGKNLIGAMVRERDEHAADIVVFRMPIPAAGEGTPR